MNILVVDDEQAVLTLARYCLSEHYSMRMANSGPEALLVLASSQIDVLVTDQRMPGMDGSELCRQAAEVSPWTMQIMVTAYADFQDLQRAVSGGKLVACLQKPLRKQELLDAIARARAIPPARSIPAPEIVTPPRVLRPRSATPDKNLRAAEAAAVAHAAGARAEFRASRNLLAGSMRPGQLKLG